MFGLEWQGQVMKQRRPGGIWRSWMPKQGFYMYWLPPFDDDLRGPDPETDIRKIADRHNVMVKLGV